jgi:hypothetical protein
MTSFPILGNPFDTQAPDSGRTMADEFKAQDEADRLNRIAYFKGRLAREQSNHIYAIYKSQLDVADARVARYKKIIKTLEGE